MSSKAMSLKGRIKNYAKSNNIAAIVGLDTRSAVDLDTTLRNLPLTEEKITEAVETICKIDMKDDVIFTVKSIEPIRKDDIYGGYCVRLDAVYDTIVTTLSVFSETMQNRAFPSKKE